jgi:hypothetical protein
MPDDQVFSPKTSPLDELSAIVPPVLMALGALSLLRTSRLLALGLVGGWLYHQAQRSDGSRHARGVSAPAKRANSALVDAAVEDSFPASDPPSFSGTTSGAG